MRIFLAGGGSQDSKLLDKRFLKEMGNNPNIIYIPNAMKDEKYPSCLKWFSSVFKPLGIKRIQMISDLQEFKKEKPKCSGIYIGGGDTTKLLREIRNSSFDRYLKEIASKNIPIYGGSAGAIIMGKTILTVPEAKDLDKKSAEGLDFLNGFSVSCHYNGTDDMRTKCKDLNTKIIAIPERSGLYMRDKIIEVIGYEPITIFSEKRKVTLHPRELQKLIGSE